jgi:hypothetical protein
MFRDTPAVHRLYGAEAYFYAKPIRLRPNYSRVAGRLELSFHNFAQIAAPEQRSRD